MVTVSTNLEQNREEGFILRWRLSPTVYLEGRRDPDSTYAGEIKWYRRY
jgi:autotransporter translocation and assembly factor TamB